MSEDITDDDVKTQVNQEGKVILVIRDREFVMTRRDAASLGGQLIAAAGSSGGLEAARTWVRHRPSLHDVIVY